MNDDRAGGASERLPGLRDRVGSVRRASARRPGRLRRLQPAGAAAARGGRLMRRRLRGLSERDWTHDRPAARRVASWRSRSSTCATTATSRARSPPTWRSSRAIALSFLWRRSRPLVTVARARRRLPGHGDLADPAAGPVHAVVDAGDRRLLRRAAPGRGAQRGRRSCPAAIVVVVVCGHLRPERHLLPGRVLLDRPLGRRTHAPQPDDARPRAGREGRARRARARGGGAAGDRRSSAAASRASCTTCSRTT